MCATQGERQRILEKEEKFKFKQRTRRWEIRKGSRMKKIFLSYFFCFTKRKFAILTSCALTYFLIKKRASLSSEALSLETIKKRLMLHMLFPDSTGCIIRKLSKKLEEDSSIDNTQHTEGSQR
jgi:hypothetical protein